MHLIKYNKIQTIKQSILISNSHMFRHRSVILRESNNIKKHNSKAPLHVLIALAVISKI